MAKGENLPENLKAGIEKLSGADLDDVRVHYNSAVPAQHRALAYTQGNEIHLAPGQDRHLAHEAWHVVQQRGGRVSENARSHIGLERDADAAANAVDLLAKRTPI